MQREVLIMARRGKHHQHIQPCCIDCMYLCVNSASTARVLEQSRGTALECAHSSEEATDSNASCTFRIRASQIYNAPYSALLLTRDRLCRYICRISMCRKPWYAHE